MWTFLWEEQTGERKWDVVEERQMEGFLEKLLNSGVHPATVMTSKHPVFFHWVWKKYHRGLSDVMFENINEEIYGTEPIKSNHKPVDVPVAPASIVTKFGWIAPDGRYFKCDYGEHSHLARKICGEINKINDPERHLEDMGWAKVLSGTPYRKRYTIGMGVRKKLTDAQLKTLQREGLDNAYGVSSLL